MDRPIGVFDSGLGGLTVARAIRAALPSEHLLYLGDTARVPYGTRSERTIMRYARICAQNLAADGIKVLVVACNTVSAVALDMLRVELDVPVIGVIGPGARAGVAATRSGKLGVIATRGTVASGAYVRAVGSLDPRVEVVPQAAPLFVPLAEEGWVEGEVPTRVAEAYLKPLADAGVDALVLGCTHYPLLRAVIEETGQRLCDRLVVADSADATAEELSNLLAKRELARSGTGELRLRVTDQPARFAEVASRFLGADVQGFEVQQVDL
ncbi:MAG: glutamate racemase [Myxococcota bacterium]